jgi:threonylcarbamoyladenosine tRNA methylthiotransferase CDKAL1
MQDLEDCGVPAAPAGVAGNTVVPRSTRAVARHGADIPGDATVFMHTFGCGHNVSDGEYMAGLLAADGYRITDDMKTADCHIINSCTVKNPSEEHFVTMLKRAKETGKPVIVAGCVPQGDQANGEWADVSVIGVRHVDSVQDVVRTAMAGNTVRMLGNDTGDALPRLALPKVRRNRYIEIIPINVGCLNFCTYCKTKHARGNLQSWPAADIVQRVRDVVAEGVIEIRLTSEDTGAYGIDIGTNVVDLMLAVVAELEGTRVMLRVGMSNPPYLMRQLEGFARVLRHANVFEFVHIPVQSGSNAVLDVMKREYSVEEFRECVDTFRRVVPNVAIATDIICAFPGEGEREWEETMELCRDIRFPVLNISRFYSRRGTPAAAMKQISTVVAKKRTQAITALFNSYADNGGLIGTTHSMWLVEVAHDKHHLVGHTKGFVQVLVDPRRASLGEYVTVRVTAATKYSVTAVVVDVARERRQRLIVGAAVVAAVAAVGAVALRRWRSA